MQYLKFRTTPAETTFFDDLKSEISNYFKSNNISNKANTEMIAKAIIWLSIWAITWSLIITFKDNFWLAVLIGLLHMWCHVMIAFNITHDANHNAMFKSKKWNTFFGYFIEILGCNKRMWDLSHNEEHHTYINIQELDNNIDGYGILRLHPEDKWFKHHKYQWIYAPFVYAISTLNYATIRDIKMLFRYAAKDKVTLSFGFLFEFVGFKILYFSYLFFIPIFVFGVSYKIVLTFFLLGHFINGLFLALLFIVGHITETTDYPTPVNNSVQKNWAVHVINTTSDFGSKSTFFQWVVGGINLHVAHHIFPKVCHVHYRHISPIIKKVAIKHGYNYREIPTFKAAIKSHFMLLKTLGLP